MSRVLTLKSPSIITLYAILETSFSSQSLALVRHVNKTVKPKTETSSFLSETRPKLSQISPRPRILAFCPRRDRYRDFPRFPRDRDEIFHFGFETRPMPSLAETETFFSRLYMHSYCVNSTKIDSEFDAQLWRHRENPQYRCTTAVPPMHKGLKLILENLLPV